MNTPYRQRGLSGLSIMGIIAMVAFLGMIAAKLFPVYLEDMGVASSVQGLKSEAGKGPGELREGLMKRFGINSVDNVTADDVIIEREQGGYRVTVDYEVWVPFIHNVDFVVSFKHSVEVPSS